MHNTVLRLAKRAIKKVTAGQHPKKAPPKFVTVANTPAIEDVLEALESACKTNGIHCVRGGSMQPGHLRLNVSFLDSMKLRNIITGTLRHKFPIVALDNSQREIKWAQFAQDGGPSPFDIGIILHQGRDGQRFVAHLEICFWREVERFTGSKVVANRPHSRIASVKRFEQLHDLPDLDAIPVGYADPKDYNFPIDVVYTWVDDADHTWAETKDQYAEAAGRPTNANARAFHNERFRNRDELRYSLRSLSMFAPFIRKIYLVTADQVPSWLDVSNDKIQVVSHREIFRDAADLPTFNSHSIESQLHRIPGLSEHFVYFNDDVFVGNISSPSDFFAPNGIVKYYPGDYYALPEFVNEEMEEYIQAHTNVVQILRRDFSMSPSNIMLHVPHAVRKSVMEELEKRYAEEFRHTAGNRFRSAEDLSPLSFLHPHYASITGRAIPCSVNQRYLSLSSPRLSAMLDDVLKTRRYRFFCLNDAGVPEDAEVGVDNKVQEFLERYFPIKSEFEI